MSYNHNRLSLEQPLNVIPLNSMPCIDLTAAVPHPEFQRDEPVEPSEPSLVYLPSQPSMEELNGIFSATKNGVFLSGSAAKGTIGSIVGKINLIETAENYHFRIALPGVSKEEFFCDVVSEGTVMIRGVTKTGEKTVFKHGMRFEMLTQNLCPTGPFSVAFTLPGPVDSQHFVGNLGIDGVFEGEVKKLPPN